VNIRRLERDEIERVWEIDRRETVENVYYLRDGELVLKPEYFDIQGWPPGKRVHEMPLLLECHDRGGTFWGAFDDDVIVGAAVLEGKFIGTQNDTLQLKFLHVGRDQRGQGLGATLFNKAVEQGRALSARTLYISATPTKRTIDFYLRRGCVLATEVDQQLFALEPEDIHLELNIS
jgi:GNAT superfamily N-acetyltransferase